MTAVDTIPSTRGRVCRHGPDRVPLVEEIATMMNPDEPTAPTAPEPPSELASKANGRLPGLNGAAPVASSGFRTWVLALSAGLAAGVIAWAIGEVTLAPEMDHLAGQGEIKVPVSVTGTHNGIASFGALGAALGLGLGLAGGLISRSFLRACLAAAIGLFLGGGVSVAVSRLILPVYYAHLTEDDLTYSLMTHGVVWSAVGGVAGLAFGLGLGGGWARTLRATVGGAGAALLATVIYEFAGGILFPLAMTNQPVSVTWQSRLVARLLVTVLVVAGVVLAAGSGDVRQGAGAGKT
jgi:hypothetical protein